MGIALYLLISGDALYLGLSLLGLGVVVAPWHSAFGRALATLGLILAMVSAVPLHPGLYGLLLVGSVANPGATLATGATQARAIPPGGAIVLVELGGNDLLAGALPLEFEADLERLLSSLMDEDRRIPPLWMRLWFMGAARAR